MSNRQKERKVLAITAISCEESRWVEKWSKSVLKANPKYVIMNLTSYGDDTEELLRKYIPEEKLILIKFPWKKSFSEARNHYLDVIPDDVDYLFYVDMDEVITEESYPEIEHVLHDPETFICLTTIYNSLDKSGMLAHLFYPRFHPWRRGDEFLHPRFGGTVHNQMEYDDKLNLPVVRAKIGIFHEGYSLSPEEMEKKHTRSEELLRQQIEDDNDSFFAHLNLAQLLRAKGEFEGTEFHANEVLRVVKGRDQTGNKYQHAKLMALDQLSTCFLGQRKPKEAIKHIEESLAIKPDYLDGLMNAGNAYLELRDLDKAEFWYRRYLFIRSKYDELKDNTNLILNHLNSSFIAYYNLGVLNIFRNDIKQALYYFKKSYEDEPKFRDVFIKYIHSLRLLNMEVEFNKRITDFMNNHSDKSFMVYDYLTDVCLEECNFELAKFYSYQAAFIDGDDDMNMKPKIEDKYKALTKLFGQVSNSFFDTDNVKAKIFDRTK